MNAEFKQGFYLGQWHVQPLHSQVVDPSGHEVHVEPRVMDVLLYLASRPGEVVERGDILEAVWDGRAMSDEPLNRCIAQLRRVFDDSPQEPRFVQTVPKRGYRLIAEIRPIENAPADAETEPASRETPAAKKPWANLWAGLGLSVLAIISAVIIGFGIRQAFFSPRPAPIDNSIVVLSLTNLGKDEDEAFGQGLSEKIRNLLAQYNGLHVVGRTSSEAVSGTDDDASAIADKLRVEFLLDGSVLRDGDLVRIHVGLTDRNGFEIWNENYERQMEVGGLLSLLDEIADGIVEKIAPEVMETLQRPSPMQVQEPTSSTDAFINVAEGDAQLMKRGPAIGRSIQWYGKAIDLDPDYAEAYVGLATAQALRPFYDALWTKKMGFAQARATIDDGVARNPAVEPMSAGIRAFMAFYGDWNWIEAQEAFDTALADRPWDPELLSWYSLFLGGVGHTAESLAVANRALQIDPDSPVVNQRMAIANLWAGNDEEAFEQFKFYDGQETSNIAQREAYLILLLRLGKFDDARRAVGLSQRLLGRDSGWVEPLFAVLDRKSLRPDPDAIDAAIAAVARAEDAGNISPLILFGIWVYLGELDRAFDEAFLLIQDRPIFNTEFLFSREAAALRRHERFAELLRAIELDEYWDTYNNWPQDVCRREGERIACR